MIRFNRRAPSALPTVTQLLAGVTGVLLLGSALWAADEKARAEPKEVVDEVASKLKELNPGFDGKVRYRTEGGAVTEIRIVTDKVTDVSPLRAFASLRVRASSGTHVNWWR